MRKRGNSLTDPKPRLVLVGTPEPPSLPPLSAFSRLLRKARRGWARFYHGCWLRHSPDLLRTLRDGRLYFTCPTCDLEVRAVLPEQVARVRPWDEHAYLRSQLKKNSRRYTK